MIYVASNGAEPLRIYFNLEDAKASKCIYIDAFDKEGFLAKAYKFVLNVGYTTDL